VATINRLLTTRSIAATIQDLDARAAKDISTEAGRVFEARANEAFWGGAKFMGECAPVNPVLPDPITLYVEVLADGRMGQLEISPMTSVARCIRGRRSEVAFPKPPDGPYVFRIELRFTK
jgi:hypothetical protein